MPYIPCFNSRAADEYAAHLGDSDRFEDAVNSEGDRLTALASALFDDIYPEFEDRIRAVLQDAAEKNVGAGHVRSRLRTDQFYDTLLTLDRVLHLRDTPHEIRLDSATRIIRRALRGHDMNH